MPGADLGGCWGATRAAGILPGAQVGLVAALPDAGLMKMMGHHEHDKSKADWAVNEKHYECE